MNVQTKQLTQRIPLDRTLWHAVRCAIGWHIPARVALTTITLHRKEGRKTIEFDALFNVQEAVCCGTTLSIERVA
jgi:hypothetical protein